MNSVTRSILVIVVIIVVFGLSYLAYDHIDQSYMLNEPEVITNLEGQVDSLKTVVQELRNDNSDLYDKLEELKSDSTETTEE